MKFGHELPEAEREHLALERKVFPLRNGDMPAECAEQGFESFSVGGVRIQLFLCQRDAGDKAAGSVGFMEAEPAAPAVADEKRLAVHPILKMSAEKEQKIILGTNQGGQHAGGKFPETEKSPQVIKFIETVPV